MSSALAMTFFDGSFERHRFGRRIARPSLFAFLELLECRPFVDRHMIGLVALDDVLRLLFGSVPLVAFEHDLRGHFLLDRASNSACLGVPFDVIASFECSCHRSAPERFTTNHAEASAGSDRRKAAFSFEDTFRGLAVLILRCRRPPLVK